MTTLKDDRTLCNAGAHQTQILCPFTPDGSSMSSNPFYVNVTDYTCDLYKQCCCPPISPDIEIAGIGVILAFLVSAALTLASTVLHMLLDRKHDTSYGHKSINPIDGFLRRHTCEPVQKLVGRERSEKFAEILYHLIISLSDAQLVTGLAILISALVQLNSFAISVYHFSLVTDLAWACASSHILSLIATRHRFSNTPEKNQGQHKTKKRISLLLRMLLIAIFVAALMYSWYYSGYSYWNDSFSCPAACVDDLEKGGEPMQWAIAYFVLVLRAYPLALLSMSTTVRASWLVRYRHRFIDHRACNESCGESKEGNHRDEGNRSSVLERVVRALRRMGRIGKVYVFLPLWYLFSSETEAVLEQVAWYIIAVYWVTVDRDHGHSIMDEEQIHEENNWAFGQIVPLLLLLIPLLEFIERTEGHTATVVEETRYPETQSGKSG